MRYFIMIAIFLVGLSACLGTKKTIEPSKERTKTAKQWVEEGYSSAIITDFSSLDGCGFLLITEIDKKELMPIQLAESFKKDKLAVWIKYHSLKKLKSTCMKGIPIQIDEVYLQ